MMSASEGGERIYVVREGDNLLDVALEVGLDLADVYCLVTPTFDRTQPLVIGSQLRIPEYPFVCHSVQDGETLATISTLYAVQPLVILEDGWNGFGEGQTIDLIPEPGTYLRIPLPANLLPAPLPVNDQGFLPLMLSQPVGTAPELVSVVSAAMVESDLQAVGGPGTLHQAPVPVDWPYGSGAFAWPMFGWLTQGYGPDHRAIDIAAPSGTLVTAADRGVVKRAGWNSQGYGLFVIVDHNIDYLTLYSHLSEVLVEEGEIVAKGEALGRVGSTGNSTGPHLHFEIRDFGHRTDPVHLLVD
jgi:murein DD-endopeptidase MepM/ murein hydrolase activator NlpD